MGLNILFFLTTNNQKFNDFSRKTTLFVFFPQIPHGCCDICNRIDDWNGNLFREPKVKANNTNNSHFVVHCYAWISKTGTKEDLFKHFQITEWGKPGEVRTFSGFVYLGMFPPTTELFFFSCLWCNCLSQNSYKGF